MQRHFFTGQRAEARRAGPADACNLADGATQPAQRLCLFVEHLVQPVCHGIAKARWLLMVCRGKGNAFGQRIERLFGRGQRIVHKAFPQSIRADHKG